MNRFFRLFIDFLFIFSSPAYPWKVVGEEVGGGDPQPAPCRTTASGEERRISSASSAAGVGGGVGREGIAMGMGLETATEGREDLRRFLKDDRRRSMDGLRPWEEGVGGLLEGAEGWRAWM